MGMYTGIRFKGYVKPRFREMFKPIALHGEWEESKDTMFSNFGGEFSRASFIPCGCLSYMPGSWEIDTVGSGEFNFDNLIPSDGFARTYDEETGYWTFQCSLKNYNSEIQAWFDLVPYFIESIEHLEYYYEEDEYSSLYILEGGKVVQSMDMYKYYADDHDYLKVEDYIYSGEIVKDAEMTIVDADSLIWTRKGINNLYTGECKSTAKGHLIIRCLGSNDNVNYVTLSRTHVKYKKSKLNKLIKVKLPKDKIGAYQFYKIHITRNP